MKQFQVSLLLISTALTAFSAASPSPVWSRDRWIKTLTRFRRQEGAADPVAVIGGGGDNLDNQVVDLHNTEFCVDVSTYNEVSFEPTPREKCDTTFEKECETKSEQVCDEVTEIVCDIQPYTECTMDMEAQPYLTFEMVQKNYFNKVCTEGMATVQHLKMMPQCKNVTKQNCITNWETDEDGNQVWAGNEACEPVTWRECQLVPRQVDFKVPKIDCLDSNEIPYTDCEGTEKEQMTTSMSCEVKHTTSCEPAVSTKCKNIEYQICSEVPKENCTTIDVMIPTQKKVHKKKCLLPDNGQFGTNSVELDGEEETTTINSLLEDEEREGRAAALIRQQQQLLASAVSAAEDELFEGSQSQIRHSRHSFAGKVGIPRVNNHHHQGNNHHGQPQQHQRRVQGQFYLPGRA